MEKEYSLQGLTIAVTNMDAMLVFYQSVFQIEFTPKEMYGATLYKGIWGEMNLLFCPAQLAKNTALQNRQQFDFWVKDLRQMLQRVTANGGTLMGEIHISEKEKSIGVKDPDGNSIVFKEHL